MQTFMQCIGFCLVLLLYNFLDTLGTVVARRPQFRGNSSFLFQEKSPRWVCDWFNLDLNLGLETSDWKSLVHVHLWPRSVTDGPFRTIQNRWGSSLRTKL